MLINPNTGRLDTRLLKLSPDARKALITFEDDAEWEQLKGGAYEAITVIASESTEQAVKLAGVLRLWRDLNEIAAYLIVFIPCVISLKRSNTSAWQVDLLKYIESLILHNP